MLLRAPYVLVALPPLAPLAGAVLFLAACSSNSGAVTTGTDSGATEEGGSAGGEGGACQGFVPPTSFNPSSPVVSFASDVLPIFQASCGFLTCHGAVTGSQAGMYLGTNGAPVDANGSLVYANLVGVASTDLPSMLRVDPGDPANSFLLHRIDDDACTLPGCTTTECSELMPQGGQQLPEANLLAVRAWIAQGAVNDLPDAGPLDAGAFDAANTSALDGAAAGDGGDSGSE
jgi:hypothetical protein